MTSPRHARNAATGSASQPVPSTAGIDCDRAKCVAPTLPTPKLLDVLHEKHVHATFSAQRKGHIDTCHEKLPRMAEEPRDRQPHLVAQMLTKLSEKKMYAELNPPQEAVRRITGHPPVSAQVPWSVTAKDYAVGPRHRVPPLIPTGPPGGGRRHRRDATWDAQGPAGCPLG